MKARKATNKFDFAALGVPVPSEPKGGESYAEDYHAAREGIICRVVWVTPEWAEKVLVANNTCNRDIKPTLAVYLASAIRNGAWVLNGESVIFADDGTLLDGQHRLRAIAQSDTPVPCLCVFGIGKDSFSTIDGTAGRSRKDVLSIPRDEAARETNMHQLAAALGWLYRWQEGQMGEMKCVLPHYRTIDLLDEHPGIRDSVTAVKRGAKKGKHPSGLMSALHYIFGLSDKAKRDDFFEQVLYTHNIKPGSVVSLLNRWLDNSQTGQNNRQRGNGAQVTIAAVVIKAWNSFVVGGPPPKILRLAADEAFPEIL
jgi:hypothetical protein